MNFLILFLLSFPLLAVECPQSKEAYSCAKYLSNYDGDTITFAPHNGGKKFKLRVLGIDTPEIVKKGKGTPCQFDKSQEAKKFVAASLKEARRIDVSGITGLDKYGRVLGKVVYDGKELDKELLKRGLAMVYKKRRQKNMNWCQLKASEGQ